MARSSNGKSATSTANGSAAASTHAKVYYRGVELAPRTGKRSALAATLRRGLEQLNETPAPGNATPSLSAGATFSSQRADDA